MGFKEVAKDAFGITGYKSGAEDGRKNALDDLEKKIGPPITGIMYGYVQVVVPISYETLEAVVVKDTPRNFSSRTIITGMALDIVSTAAAIAIATDTGIQGLAAGIGTKLVYNATVSAAPDVVRNLRQRIRPTHGS